MEHSPYWWIDAGEPAALSDTHALPASADVLIVGAGLTGLSAALTLARAGKHVVVIERGPPGIGASSRNGGQVGGGHRLPPAVMDNQYGTSTATRLLREAHIDSVDFFRNLVDTHAIACDWQAVGRFRGNWTQPEYDTTARDTEKLNRRIGLAAYAVPRAEQHNEIASDLYSGGTVFPTHGAINPARFTRGLAHAARAAGADIHSFTELLGLEQQGGKQRVITSRGTLVAGDVLAATNGYSGPALPEIARRVLPVPSFIVATEPLGTNRVRALMPAGRVYVESRVRHCYFRPSPDGERLVFGGRAALVPVSERFALSQLRKLIGSVFPELGDVALSHSWRGFTGFSFAQVPHLGRVDGVHVAMGYAGNGNTMAPYLGHKAALRILGDPEGETAFANTRFESRFWHRGRPWFMPAADLRFRAQDLWDTLRRTR